MGNQSSLTNREEGLPETETRDPIMERVVDLAEKIALSRDEKECQMAVDNFKRETVIKSLMSQYTKLNFTPVHAIVSLLTFTQETELDLLEWLVTEAPWMAVEPRKGSFEGQTPLHMAICKNNYDVVQILLEKLRPEMKEQLIHMSASGISFQQTVMRAEFPLAIAACIGNTDIVDLLIRHGADLTQVNSKGDNIYQILIQYVYLYPMKSQKVQSMLTHICEGNLGGMRSDSNKLGLWHLTDSDSGSSMELTDVDKEQLFRKKLKVLFMTNNKGENPLQTAIHLGQAEIFNFIMESGYCYFDCKEGTFDIKMYDVTDITRVLTQLNGTNDHGSSNDQQSSIETRPSRFFRSITQQIVLRDKKQTPLDFLFTMKQDCAFEFARSEPVSRFILQKWRFYRFLFYPMMVLHVLFMCFFTWYVVKRSDVRRSTINDISVFLVKQLNGTLDNKSTDSNQHLTVCSLINLVAGVAYFIQELIRHYKNCLPFTWKRLLSPYANNGFRIGFVLFSIPLIVDVFTLYAEQFQQYVHISAVLIGWSLCLFFLRALPQFCQFASLIQTVLTGDIIRFFCILVLELIAFSTVMFMLMQGSDEDETFVQSWSAAFFVSFQVMFGFKNISFYQSENVIILAILYILFLFLTTVLVINSLIATISAMCNKLFQPDDEMIHLRLHQYAAIRFLESLLPDRIVQNVEREILHMEDRYIFDVKSDQFKKTTRYFVKMESLRNISGSVMVQDAVESFNSIHPDCDYQIDEDADFLTGITGNMASALFTKDTNEEKPNTEEQYVLESPSMKEIHVFGKGLCDVCHKTFAISSLLMHEINTRQNAPKMENVTKNYV